MTRKAKLWIGAGVFLAFMLGLFLGAAGTAHHARRYPGRIFAHMLHDEAFEAHLRAHWDRSTKLREKALRRIAKRLDLTEQQVAQVREIMDRDRKKAENSVLGFRAEMRALLDGTRNDVRGLLNEEQKKEFDSMVEKWMRPRCGAKKRACEERSAPDPR